MGQLQRHGGYSYIARGVLPKHLSHIRKFLEYTRKRLILDFGGPEEVIPIAIILLIDRVISKLGILRCLEEQARRSGIFVSGELSAPLRESYIAYSNSMRRDIMALDKLKPESKGKEGLDPLVFAAEVAAGKHDSDMRDF